MNERDILYTAVKATQAETGLEWKIQVKGLPPTDGLLWLKEYPVHRYEVEIKKWAQHKGYGALVHQVANLNNGILVADYVNPNMAERLKADDIQFMDCEGNAYIKHPNHFIWVRGNRRRQQQIGKAVEHERALPIKPVLAAPEGRLLGPTGLKVIYQLLLAPRLIRAPYREIAQRAGVALGNIGWVMKALKDREIIPKGATKTKIKITKPDELLRLFVENYPVRLKPKLALGTFEGDYLANMYLDFDVDLNELGGAWGGEVAAAYQTKALKPEVWTIYLKDKTKLYALIGEGMLRKTTTAHKGEGRTMVEIYEAFWPEVEPEYLDMAPCTDPVLTYTDLIATGDPRNHEVAERLLPKIKARFDG